MKYKREGAEQDSQNILSTFKKFGYEVTLWEDLSKEEAEKKFDSIRDDQSLARVDSLIIFILSHGLGKKNQPFIFLANDRQKMSLTDIRQRFSARNCPQLQYKPKVFFCNFCRGPNKEQIQKDGDGSVPHNTATIHASAEDCQAFRDSARGTVLVDRLCEILNKTQASIELRQVYQKLTQSMPSCEATTPAWEEFAFSKKFYFTKSY